jgi:hypothetical protein
MTPDELVAKNIAPIKPEFLVQRQAIVCAGAAAAGAAQARVAALSYPLLSVRLCQSSHHTHALHCRWRTRQTLT